MRTPEDKKRPVVSAPSSPASRFLYDYEICHGQASLQKVIDRINRHGYDLASVTQDLYGTYTVFFRRPAHG